MALFSDDDDEALNSEVGAPQPAPIMVADKPHYMVIDLQIYILRLRIGTCSAHHFFLINSQ